MGAKFGRPISETWWEKVQHGDSAEEREFCDDTEQSSNKIADKGSEGGTTFPRHSARYPITGADFHVTLCAIQSRARIPGRQTEFQLRHDPPQPMGARLQVRGAWPRWSVVV